MNGKASKGILRLLSLRVKTLLATPQQEAPWETSYRAARYFATTSSFFIVSANLSKALLISVVVLRSSVCILLAPFCGLAKRNRFMCGFGYELRFNRKLIQKVWKRHALTQPNLLLEGAKKLKAGICNTTTDLQETSTKLIGTTRKLWGRGKVSAVFSTNLLLADHVANQEGKVTWEMADGNSFTGRNRAATRKTWNRKSSSSKN